MTDVTDLREVELREINLLACELGYIKGEDRGIYEALLHAYFGETSALELKAEQRAKWINMLRQWAVGRPLVGIGDRLAEQTNGGQL